MSTMPGCRAAVNPNDTRDISTVRGFVMASGGGPRLARLILLLLMHGLVAEVGEQRAIEEGR
jgi:hypothetical protein